jgi:alpha-tubulin suppressor-like RCC1 family protein
MTGVLQIAAGGENTCALLADRSVACWGSNPRGQLGNGATNTMSGTSTPTTVPGLVGVQMLAVGDSHTCALLTDGSARCWGCNMQGELGDGTTEDRSVPTPVLGLTDAVEIAAGSGFTCARMRDATVRCWGNNQDGELGDGTHATSRVGLFDGPRATSPQPVPGLANVTALALGYSHGCALIANGTVQCWGSTTGGQLGEGTWGLNRYRQPSDPDGVQDQLALVRTPTPVPGIGSAVGIAAGHERTCAWLRDGTARCWGVVNPYHTYFTPAVQGASPQAIDGLEHVAQLTAGAQFTCARGNDGSVRCWGMDGFSGVLGNGTEDDDRESPAFVHW